MNSIDDPKGSPAPPVGSASSALSLPSPASAIENAKRRFGGGGRTPPPPSSGNDEDEEEEGMLRMSFMEHLTELRSRIIKAMVGCGVAFIASLSFSERLWDFVCQPAAKALTALGYNPPQLHIIEPMEGFNIIWFKLPLVCAIFLSCPWLVYQAWAFVSPGLYRRERRWAAPFILVSAGLFILGGVFAYFVIFPYGLTFLLSIGKNYGSSLSVVPTVTVTEYFDIFVNVIMGVGLVFELPVLIFFLTLLRLVTPGFLMNHSRYAILIIFIVAAIVTPTPDVVNLMLFATPMCLLFYVGIFASYLLVLHRENRKFPWKTALTIVLGVLILLGVGIYLAIFRFGYKLAPHWPFLTH
jgi:sec-independent protein translocase protein TatC